MSKYHMNKNRTTNPKSNYEVHKEGCIPWPSNTVCLGEFINCKGAIYAAKRKYPKDALIIDGCSKCTDCHNE